MIFIIYSTTKHPQTFHLYEKIFTLKTVYAIRVFSEPNTPKYYFSWIQDSQFSLSSFRWDNRTSFVAPEDDIFYLVAFLSQAVPSKGTDGLEQILNQNKRILHFCESANLGAKQYLPHYTTQNEWRAHFGPRWEVFARRKSAYDPLAILAPGQRIFQNPISYLWRVHIFR